MTDPERDILIAEAMGWTRWSSGLVPRGSGTPDCWWTGNPESPTRKIKYWLPTTSVEDFALVEQAIHDRGLGEKYVAVLAEQMEILKGIGYCGDEVWELMRAPLSQKAAAALSVLEGNT